MHLGDPGEETLVGDFIQLLIREENSVKPKALGGLADWEIWNAGYNVTIFGSKLCSPNSIRTSRASFREPRAAAAPRSSGHGGPGAPAQSTWA